MILSFFLNTFIITFLIGKSDEFHIPNFRNVFKNINYKIVNGEITDIRYVSNR